MRRLFLLPVLLCACPAEPPTTGVLDVSLTRQGDPTALTAAAGDKTFSVTMTEGLLSVVSVSLSDLEVAPEVTIVRGGSVVFDLVNQSELLLASLTLEPVSFEELRVVPGDAQEGALSGLSLRLVYDVTLSDNALASVTAQLTLGPGGADEIVLASPIAIEAGDQKALSLAVSLESLVSGIDYDALAAIVGSNIDIVDNTGIPEIDEAIGRMVESVFTTTFLLGTL